MQRLACLIVFIIFSLNGSAIAKMLDVEADDIFKTGSRIEAHGNVIVTGEDITLKADYVVYDTASEDIWATGNCFLKEGKRGEVSAMALSYNAKRKDMHIQNGMVLFYTDAIKISGESISQFGEEYITGQSVEITHCLGTIPDWSIDAEKLEIPEGGYGSAQEARFKVHEWPIVKIPYLLFPAMLERHSGLLIPEISHGSDYGYRFGMPVYVVLGRSADWTITPTWLSTRGLLMENEFRYALDYDKNGLIYLETLHDMEGGDKTTSGILPTIPHDRWFIKSEQTGTNFNWDLNLVNNVDYFRDIGTFYNSNFFRGGLWGGEVNQLDDSKLDELISRFQLMNSYNGMSFSLSSQWKQDLTQDDNSKTLQELPRLTARLRERSVPYTPFQVSAEITSVKLYTEDSIEARKDNAQMELAWPINLFPYLTLRPFVDELYRDTAFTETKDLYSDSMFKEHWEERGATLSTTLYSSRFMNGLYHQVVPEISMVYLSRTGGNENPQNPEDVFPQLLTGDDLEKTHNMIFSLSNYIRDKQGVSLADAAVDVYYSYILKQWNEIDIRSSLHPLPWLTATHLNTFTKESDNTFSTSQNSTTITFNDPRGDSLSFGEEYFRSDSTVASADIKANILKGLNAEYDMRYDAANHRFDSESQIISYYSQCWAVIFERNVYDSSPQVPRKTTWSFNVKLLGIGDTLRSGLISPAGVQK